VLKRQGGARVALPPAFIRALPQYASRTLPLSRCGAALSAWCAQQAMSCIGSVCVGMGRWGGGSGTGGQEE